MGFVPHLNTAGDDRPPAHAAIPRLVQSAWEVLRGEREGYPYSLHADENVHWVLISNVQRYEDVFVKYPSGAITDRSGVFTLRGAVHERGFHVVMAEIQGLTGVPFETLFHVLPAAWLGFTAFALYALLRPHPAALPAAAFVGLVPTTVRFLGPGFLVPIGFALAWIPATLIVAEQARHRVPGMVLLLVLAAWAYFVHLTVGIAVLALLAFWALSRGREHWKTSLALLALAASPAAWFYQTFRSDIAYEVAREENLPIDFTIFDGFGLLALFGWAAGVLLIVAWPPARRSGPVHAFTALSVGALGLIVASVAWDLDRYATYARWHAPFFLAAAVPLGYAVVGAATFAREAVLVVAGAARRARPAAAAVGVVAAVALTAVFASSGTAGHLREPYYHLIQPTDWERFTWIRDNVGPEYEVFLGDPWQAPVLTALTGKEPHAWLAPGWPPARGEDYVLFSRTGGTLEFFLLHDITLVISDLKPPFPEFVTLAPGVHAIDPKVAKELAEIRNLNPERAA